MIVVDTWLLNSIDSVSTLNFYFILFLVYYNVIDRVFLFFIFFYFLILYYYKCQEENVHIDMKKNN